MANWHVSDEFISVNIDRMRVIKSLLKHGADVNARNTDMEPRWSGARYRRRQVGLTPFLAAARQADIEVMRLLLENGADPKLNTPLNITPLMLAAGIAWASNQDRASEEQVLEAVKMLVEELGADVNFVADTGETAMHAAAYRGVNSVVQYLFDKGAKLDVVGPERTNAAAGRRWCRVWKFIRCESTYGGAAAQARGEGNSVSRLVPECDPGRSVATRGGCAMRHPLWVAAACFMAALSFSLQSREPAFAQAAPAVQAAQIAPAGPGGDAVAANQATVQKYCVSCHNDKGEIGRARAQHVDHGERHGQSRGRGNT